MGFEVRVGDTEALAAKIQEAIRKMPRIITAEGQRPWIVAAEGRTDDGKATTLGEGCEAVSSSPGAISGRSRGVELAHGDRMAEYGDPEESFGRIAELWTTYLEAVPHPGLTGGDVARMMILLKLSRSITDHKADTLDDIDGYVECLRMLESHDA